MYLYDENIVSLPTSRILGMLSTIPIFLYILRRGILTKNVYLQSVGKVSKNDSPFIYFSLISVYFILIIVMIFGIIYNIKLLTIS